jgi:hypothetical protein
MKIVLIKERCEELLPSLIRYDINVRREFEQDDDHRWDKELREAREECYKTQEEIKLLRSYEDAILQGNPRGHIFLYYNGLREQLPSYLNKGEQYGNQALALQHALKQALGHDRGSFRRFNDSKREEARSQLKNIAREWDKLNESVMKDMISIANFIDNPKAREEAKVLEERYNEQASLTEKRDSYRTIEDCLDDEAYAEVTKSYKQELKRLRSLRTKELKRVQKLIAQLESKETYEVQKEKILKRRADELRRIKEEEERVLLEKQKLQEIENQRQAKAYKKLMSKLRKTGYGLGEMSKNNKEKKAYNSEVEAKQEIIRAAQREGILLKAYPKTFYLKTGEGTHTLTQWFLTSQDSVRLAS